MGAVWDLGGDRGGVGGGVRVSGRCQSSPAWVFCFPFPGSCLLLSQLGRTATFQMTSVAWRWSGKFCNGLETQSSVSMILQWGVHSSSPVRWCCQHKRSLYNSTHPACFEIEGIQFRIHYSECCVVIGSIDYYETFPLLSAPITTISLGHNNPTLLPCLKDVERYVTLETVLCLHCLAL